jgi:hypothetical protein
MNTPRLRLVFPALLLVGSAALGTAFAADDIKAEAILDKYIEVTGGRAAYEKVQSEMSTGTLEIASAGLTGTLTIYRAAPDKSYTLIEFGGVGKAEEGSNGQVAWSLSAMEGARIKEGEERTLALRSDAFHSELRWREFYKKAEVAGSEDVNGKPCYKVVMTPSDGSPETRYYDKSSNLLVKVILPISTPQMSGNAETTLSDYKSEDGISSPHTITEKLPSAEFMVKISSVKYNPEIPAGRFDLPAEIKALQTPKTEKSEKK